MHLVYLLIFLVIMPRPHWVGAWWQFSVRPVHDLESGKKGCSKLKIGRKEARDVTRVTRLIEV